MSAAGKNEGNSYGSEARWHGSLVSVARDEPSRQQGVSSALRPAPVKRQSLRFLHGFGAQRAREQRVSLRRALI